MGLSITIMLRIGHLKSQTLLISSKSPTLTACRQINDGCVSTKNGHGLGRWNVCHEDDGDYLGTGYNIKTECCGETAIFRRAHSAEDSIIEQSVVEDEIAAGNVGDNRRDTNC